MRKQTVFDDFQDAAIRLTADGVTTPRRLGIRGLSNGGLLTAACYNQRPDLFGAVIAEIPLADVMWLDTTDKGRASRRCWWWSPRTTTPRRRARPTASSPAVRPRPPPQQLVLLRTLPDVGHVGWPRGVMLDALADEVAFLETISSPARPGAKIAPAR